MKKRVWMVMAFWAMGLSARAAVEFTATVSSGTDEPATTRGVVDGPNARVEFLDGGTGGMEKGNYVITRDGGKTVTLVDPEEKRYMRIDPEKMAASVGQFMNAAKGFMSVSFKNPSVKTLSDEKGPSLLGLPTRRVRTRTAYTVETRVFGRSSVSAITRDDETWLTTKMRDAGFNLLMAQRRIRTGNEEIDQLIELENAKLKGFPLKVVSKTVTRDEKGREETVETVYEMTALRTVPAPAGAFDVPEGYRDGMEELNNELRRAQDEAEKEDDAEGPDAGAVNSLLKGIFGGGR